MQPQYLPWVSACRGLAILLVMLLHLTENIMPFLQDPVRSAAAWVTVGVIDIGKIGVVLLFLLSGYLAGGDGIKNGRCPFLLGRVVRLYPPYIMCVLVASAVGMSASIFQTLANLTMAQQVLGYPDIVGAFWTMPIELGLVGLCFVFSERILEKRIYMAVFGGLAFLSLVLAALRFLSGKALPVGFFLLLLTALLGLGMRRYTNSQITGRAYLHSLAAYGACVLAVCLLAYSRDYGLSETWYRYLISYAVGLVIFQLACWKGFSFAPLEWIGKYGYSLYLMHGVVLYLITEYLRELPQWFYILLFWCGSFLLAWLLYTLVEKPVLKYWKTRRKSSNIADGKQVQQ